MPARLEDFVDYGRAFQRRLVPHLEEVMVESLEHFAALPKTISNLQRSLVTHSSEHNDLRAFKGRKVGVIGGRCLGGGRGRSAARGRAPHRTRLPDPISQQDALAATTLRSIAQTFE
jgi:hypothetical protein